jgi:hypothetical protein
MPIRLKSAQKLRMQIAEVAAKLVAVDEVADYHSAKRKAASQLGVSTNKNLPSNQEIEEALINYQHLFQTNKHRGRLKDLRTQAIVAMKLLHQFKPLLVGPVASGTATHSTEVTLHLYCDHVERVGLFLLKQGIPNRLSEKQIKISLTRSITCPAYHFIADQTLFVLVIFSEKDRNLSPVSSIDNRSMKMINIAEALVMIEEINNSPPI